MDVPSPDPAKLLEAWMEWERGDTTPGRVMSNLKTGGMRDVLEALVAAGGEDSGSAPSHGGAGEEVPAASGEPWTPVV
jgi:hypothetical protein